MNVSSIPLSRRRNLGIIAHIDAGKTTLSERLLWKAGAIRRTGEVHDGAATMDHMELERERGITIGSAATQLLWTPHAGLPHRYTLIDTPGHIDFSIEVERSLRVLDGAIAVFCAVAGVQPQSETVWRQARRHGVPTVVFVNKMDRTGADFNRVISDIHTRLEANVLPLALPVGQEEAFQGLSDLLMRQVLTWTGTELVAREWTSEEAVVWEPAREAMIERVAEFDDLVLELWLQGQTPSVDQLRLAIRQATLAGTCVPALPGSAFKNKGMELLLDAVAHYLPSPSDRTDVYAHASGQTHPVVCDPQKPTLALVFKVVETPHGAQAFVRVYQGTLRSGDVLLNVGSDTSVRVGRLAVILAGGTQDVACATAGDIVALLGTKDLATGHTLSDPSTPMALESIAVQAPVLAWRLSTAASADASRLSAGLAHLAKEDPSLRLGTDPQTGEVVIWGMGELHLDVAVERLRREYGVAVKVGSPLVAYQEYLASPLENLDVVLSKQTGGKGQYARVVIHVSPRADGQVEFVNQIKGGVIPADLVAATEKGIRDGLSEGPRGYPVLGLTITLVDGQTHPVDSSAQAFVRVGQMAIRQALLTAGTTQMEPVMALDVQVPDDNVGAVVSDLARKQGQVLALDHQAQAVVIRAQAPLSHLAGYTTTLRSLTAGRGQVSMTLSGYQAVIEN